MAADETLRFNIVADDKASEGFSRAGRSVSDMGDKMDKAATKAMFLDDALKRQKSSTKAASDASLSLARSDAILAEVEGRLRDGALEAEFALKREAEAKKKDADATNKASAENSKFASSLAKIADSMKSGGGPAWLGPLLALGPAAGVLGGVALGAAGGLTGAFVAAAGAAAAFGAVAKPVLTQALTAEQGVSAAQVAYNAAIANGTKQAVAYKAEQIAIAKAYAGMSPQQIALSKQLGDMSSGWQKLKQAETPVVAGALQPWLKSVTDLTKQLAPIIASVSPVIGQLGDQFDGLVRSPAFAAFRDFIAGTGTAAISAAGSTLLDFLQSAIILLPKFNPLINKAIIWIGDLGPAVLKWSSSKKASDDITKFMAWFTTNGPVVGNLLKNIGLALKNIAPGLGPAAATEMNIMTSFFGYIAKLPPSIAKPLLTVAGVMLTLNKLGVVKVGVNLVTSGLSGLGVLGGGAAKTAAKEEGETAGATAGAGFVAGLQKYLGIAAIGVALGYGMGEAIKHIPWAKVWQPIVASWNTTLTSLGLKTNATWSQVFADAEKVTKAKMQEMGKTIAGAAKAGSDAWNAAAGVVAGIVRKMPVKVIIKGDITDLTAKLNSARLQLISPGLTKTRTAQIHADISQLQQQIAAAQAALDIINGRVVTTFIDVVNQVSRVVKTGFASGTNSAPPGLAWVGEHGPELMRFRGGEQVMSASASSAVAAHRGGNTYNAYVTVNAPVGSHPVQIGREVAQALAAFKKSGGWVYKPGGF